MIGRNQPQDHIYLSQEDVAQSAYSAVGRRDVDCAGTRAVR
jgi:hypothetical protein